MDADPGPNSHFDADATFYFDSDPIPTSQFSFNADPDPASQNEDPCGSRSEPLVQGQDSTYSKKKPYPVNTTAGETRRKNDSIRSKMQNKI